MKTVSYSWLLWLATIASAAGQNAYLHYLDISPRPTPFPAASIDTETANAILARRMGATDWLELAHLSDDGSFERLNQYGGKSQSLLGIEQTLEPSGRLVAVIEGYDGEAMPTPQVLTIERANTDLAATSYVESLVLHDFTQHDPTGVFSPCKGSLRLDSGAYITYVLNVQVWSGCPVLSDFPSAGDDLAAAINPLHFLNALKSHREGGWKMSFKLDMTRMESSPAARKLAAMETFMTWYETLNGLVGGSNDYGTVQSTLLLLPSQRVPPPRRLTPRRNRLNSDETPLPQPLVALTKTIPDTTLTSPSDSNSSSSSTIPLPPLGSFLPSCFASNEICTERTNACSGHGSCGAKSSKCFVCNCGSTVVRQDSDGGNVKTVQWGGSACERKDVSVPFFLFAGFAVAMSAVVAGSIGMMFSMGSEKLPGVIGAGVAGPKAQR